jgi:hypothetical protein
MMNDRINIKSMIAMLLTFERTFLTFFGYGDEGLFY